MAASVVALLLFAGWMFALQRPSSAQTQGTQSNVQYGEGSGIPLLMDVYPPQGTAPFPALIVLHPGGFVKGDKTDPKVVTAAQDFAQAGFEAFSLNYRLVPQFPYPAAVQDVETAISFIRQHAAQFHIDPKRIGAMGGSAGATLAVSAADEGSGSLCTGSRVVAVVSWSGALDFERIVQEQFSGGDSLEEYAGIVGPHHRQLISAADAPAALAAASPFTHLDKTDPPMFIANSQHEFMPLDQALTFLAELKQLHIPNAFFSLPAGGHAYDYTAKAMQPTIDFLDTYLKKAKCVAATPTPTPSRTPTPTAHPTGGGTGTPGATPTGGSGGLPLIPIVIVGFAAILVAAVIYRVLSWRRMRVYRR
jgi:acetyl esterase